MKHLMIALLAVASFSLVARAEDPPLGQEIYPLALGHRWTYRIQGQDDRLTIQVVAIDMINGVRCYRLEGKIQNRVIATEHVAKLKDGLYRYRNEGIDIDPPLLLCKFPVEKGDAWKAEYKHNEKKASLRYECDLEEVTVLHGKYQSVVIHSITADNSKLKNSVWYAPRIGMVKQVIEEGEQTIVLTLERFDRGFEKK